MDKTKIKKTVGRGIKAGNARYTKLVLLLVAVLGVVMLVLKAVDWGASHQVIIQRPWDLSFKPTVVIVEREPEVILSPIVDRITENDFTPTEQKILDIWGYRNGLMALAIFDCGESGLDQYAVSPTGDLGIAQINWATWKNEIESVFGYTSAELLEDVDKNLEVAYWIWDRDGDGEGNWNPWSGFLNGAYLNCLR